ncbi:MAG: hypothetical protein ACI4XR_04465 [Bacilli bacterium]
MDTKEVKKTILELEKKDNIFKTEAENLQKKIITEIKNCYGNEMESLVIKEVKNQPEKTKSLGKDELSNMKSELSDIIKNLDNSVDEIMSNNKFWIHLNKKTYENDNIYQVPRNAKHAIEDGVREIFGLVGKLLIKYNYCEAKAYNNHYNFSPWYYEKENPNKIIYGYGITLIKCVDELANKYGTCIFDRIKNKQELQQAKEKLEKQEAIALWDEA